MVPTSISTINQLSPGEKREFYKQVIPSEMFNRFSLPATLIDPNGNDFLSLTCPSGSTTVEMALFHQAGFLDPILYGHLTDTMNGQVHVLLYILNDPESPRFDVDKMPDGSPTKFGTFQRNCQAEQAAMQAGLAPGQVRRGLRLLGNAISTFEAFIQRLGNDLYFAEPLYYHNAIIFERYGFSYQSGRKLMERIQSGFSPGGDLVTRLDGSTPFRMPEAADNIRLRSWALHDGILGEPFTNVTMYKRVGKAAGISTSNNTVW